MFVVVCLLFVCDNGVGVFGGNVCVCVVVLVGIVVVFVVVGFGLL